MRNTVGLVMIVKNERDVILRCLASMRPLIDYVLIVDTGSSDDTILRIRAYLEAEDLPGEVIERPWRNFAANRSEALEALRQVEMVDYGITIDADETLAIDPGFDVEQFKAGLSADLYAFEVHNSQTIYRRPMLFSNRKAFVYKAVLHEFLEAPAGSTRALGEGLHVVVSQDGARSQNPNKYAEDADLTRRVNMIMRTDYMPSAKVCHLWERASYRSLKMMRIHLKSLHTYFKKWGYRLK